MANATNMSRVLDIVEAAAAKEPVILVSSAISGCTDKLIEFKPEGIEFLKKQHHDIIVRLFTGEQRDAAILECDALFDEMSRSDKEVAPTFGELFSTRILARKLVCEGEKALWIDSRDIIVKDDPERSYANIARVVAANPDVRIFVAPGFIARDLGGYVTTLGRGGSDYSAALYAVGSGASHVDIWTDVPGIMTANPKEVRKAHTIPDMSYRAAFDLAKYGAKVLYAPTVEPARLAGIPIRILNTFDPSNPGTVISDKAVKGVVGWAGVTSLSDPEKDEATVCMVGEGEIDSALTLARITSYFKKAGIHPIDTDCRSRESVCFIKVRKVESREALSAIHREFFETANNPVINVFIAGYGAVGHALIDLIEQNADTIAERSGKNIRIVGLSDSKHFVIDPEGIPSSEAMLRLAVGSPAENWAFIDAIEENTPLQAVFVDCTNSESIHSQYSRLFRKGIGVVSSNRRSLAVPYSKYAAMKAEAQRSRVPFHYETTVGTALPVLESIALSANSSEEIVSIEAIVSCTLNLLLSCCTGDRKFGEVLRSIQLGGLTETDPRIDLKGLDALRKLLILAREAGVPLESGDVEITPVVGPDILEGSLEEFYAKLIAADPKFGEHQRFVASLVKDASARLGYRARISLQEVDEKHPAYWLQGTDNIVIIRSAFHLSPLVIKGAGEGARQAASGILNDILKI